MKHKLIQVKYWNNQKGFVDDVTLNELIRSHKIGQFYRPSQEKWINIETDPVRVKHSQYGGPERREPDEEEEEADQLEEKPHGLLSRLFRPKEKPIVPKKAMTAEDWFERGFMVLHTVDDWEEAVRAFAKSIDMDPAYERAYVNRGIAYERVGNLQQAIDDYSKAIELTPEDAKVYYVRGLALKRLGMCNEAMEDLQKAARMGYRQAIDYFKSRGLSF